MGKFSNQSYVSFGPITRLCTLFMQGNISLNKSKLKSKSNTGLVMNTNENNQNPNQITSFLGKLAYAAQAQEFVNEKLVNLNLNQAVIFSSYRQSTSSNQNFSFHSSSLQTRIGCGPLYKN